MSDKKKKIIQDLGFETKLKNTSRFINKDGSFNVYRRGGNIISLYHILVETSILNFSLLITAAYLLINLFFAVLYFSLGPEAIAGIETSMSLGERFAYAFFLSVQTFTSVGYGTLSPIGIWSNFISTFNALVGLMSFAIATGLVFARFSNPEALFVYSDAALLAKHEDKQSLIFRVANIRSNKIINLEAKVILAWTATVNGVEESTYVPLALESEKVMLFPLNWNIVHLIDEQSPLYQKTKEEIIEMRPELIILLNGYDETYAHQVYDNHSYTVDEFLWDVKFVKMYELTDHATIINLNQISETEKI